MIFRVFESMKCEKIHEVAHLLGDSYEVRGTILNLC